MVNPKSMHAAIDRPCGTQDNFSLLIWAAERRTGLIFAKAIE
jgi:hypothetical protein